MKKIEIKRKIKYSVVVNGMNELTTANEEDVLELIKRKLKNNDVHIVIRDLNKKEE